MSEAPRDQRALAKVLAAFGPDRPSSRGTPTATVTLDKRIPPRRTMTTAPASSDRTPATFATGGGGTVFELRVATWIAASMAAGSTSPLGGRPISIEFQTSTTGFDDLRVQTDDAGPRPWTYDLQIRHRQPLTSTNEKFRVLVEAGCTTIARDPDEFADGNRRLALVVAPNSPSHKHLRDLCALARDKSGKDPDVTVASARSTIRDRWKHLCAAAPSRSHQELWRLAGNLDVIAVDLSSLTTAPVIAVLNELAALWRPSSPDRAVDVLNALFTLMGDLDPGGSSVDEHGLRQRIPSLPASDAEPSRRTRLHSTAAASHARITGSLKALGIRDPVLLGRLAEHALADPRPLPGTGIWLLEGDMGVGKSAVLERSLHYAVQHALNTRDAPVPVYARAVDLTRATFRELVLNRAREIGDPYRTGMHLVIDGLDEAGLSPSDVAPDLVALHAELPSSTFLVGTRPTFNQAGLDCHPIGPLSDASLIELLEILGIDPRVRFASEALHSTLQRPLFAILYAIHKAEGSVTSPAELIARMASSGVQELANSLPDAMVPLTRLAAAVLDASGAPVPLNDLALTTSDRRAFVESRLVDLSGNRAGFQVAALTEWFAGTALRLDLGLLGAVAENPKRAHQWRWAVASMIAQLSAHDGSEDIDAALTALTHANPALARWALKQATSTDWHDRPVPPPAEEAAAAVNATFAIWHGALAPASELHRPGPTQPPLLGVARDETGITCAVEATTRLEILQADGFPLGVRGPFLPDKPGSVWFPFHSGGIRPGPAWAWVLTAGIYEHHLKRLIESSSIVADSPALYPELLWRYGAATQPGPLRRSVAVDDIDSSARRSRAMSPDADTIHVGGLTGSAWDVATAEALVEHLRATGTTVVNHPWPLPNWDHQNPETLDVGQYLRSLEAASDAGLGGYEQTVNKWLPHLAPFLPLYAILPARVRGWISIIPSPFQPDEKWIDHVWTIEPVADPTEGSRWELVDRLDLSMIDLDSARARLEHLRPNAPANAYNGYTQGEGPWHTKVPATAFALEQLASDLRAHAWIEHLHSREPRLIAPTIPGPSRA